jgi:hypothetical protein
MATKKLRLRITVFERRRFVVRAGPIRCPACDAVIEPPGEGPASWLRRRVSLGVRLLGLGRRPHDVTRGRGSR